MNLSVIDFGVIAYKQAFYRQLSIHREVVIGQSPHTLILCEHPHTITLGKQAALANILDYNSIRDRNIDFIIAVNRGGDVTYHGPGQLMVYFIFDLRKMERNLGLFLNRIEEVVVKTIDSFNIEACTKYGFRGVWVGALKIACVGIGVEKWVTLHGFGLNVNTDLSFFDIIRPCGLDVKMTSLKQEVGSFIDIDRLKQEIIKQTCFLFNLTLDDGYQPISPLACPELESTISL